MGTSLLMLIAFPILAGALLMLEADRLFGAYVYNPSSGGRILWQHLFAHIHYVVFGTVVFAMFAGLSFWWPKMTSRMLGERAGQAALLAAVRRRLHHAQSGLRRAGSRRTGARFHTTFLVQH